MANGSHCRSWLTSVRATAPKEVIKKFRKAAVLGDGKIGYTVELHDATQIHVGRQHCAYCAKATALKQLATAPIEQTALLTITKTLDAIRALGMRAYHRNAEYRVNFPNGDEATAYYTTDSTDAIATAQSMLKLRPGLSPNEIKYQVVPSLVLQHTVTKERISAFTAIPHGSADEWERIETGWTVYNPHTNTHGIGRLPWLDRAEAQAYADTHLPPRISLGD